MSPRRGRFVVLEGLDGAGTTSQLERVGAALRAQGWTVLATREPSEGPVGSLIRQALTGRVGLPGGRGPLDAATLALLFAADRTDHLEAVIRPALARGEVVLCDRYLLSSLAYQGASLPMDWVATINARADDPDLTLFLEVDGATAARRRAARGKDAELFEQDAHQRKVARAYREAIRRREGHERLLVIDGRQPIEAVTSQALEAVRRILPRR